MHLKGYQKRKEIEKKKVKIRKEKKTSLGGPFMREHGPPDQARTLSDLHIDYPHWKPAQPGHGRVYLLDFIIRAFPPHSTGAAGGGGAAEQRRRRRLWANARTSFVCASRTCDDEPHSAPAEAREVVEGGLGSSLARYTL